MSRFSIGGLLVLLSAVCCALFGSCDAWISAASRTSQAAATTAKRRHPALGVSGKADGALFQSSTALDPDHGDGVPSTTTSSSDALPIDAYYPKHGELTADLTPIAFGSPPDAMVLEEGTENAVLVIDDTQLPLYQLALAGSLTTALADMLVHPMDCVKTLQQQHQQLGLGAAIRQLYDTAGLAGFYHGFLTYAGTDAVSGAIKFAVWEVWKQRVIDSDENNSVDDAENDNNNDQNVLMLLTGAALAFVASSVTLVPGELLKQALQMEQYHSFQDAIAGIYQQNNNLSGFYTGYSAILCRDVPYTALELTLYELFKRFTAQMAVVATPPQQQQQQRRHGEPEGETTDEDTLTSSSSSSNEILAAIVTGAFAATLTNPSDVVKTQMMMNTAAEAPSSPSSSSFLDCWASIAADHGPLALFAGAAARVAWIVPFTALYLPTYDALKRWLWKRHVRYTAEAQVAAAEQQQQPPQSQSQPQRPPR